MDAFTTLTSIAAPLPDADIDTDIIFPARFLTLTQKKGLGRYAFHDKRLPDQPTPFVLDQPRWQGARILVTGPNFGCGSSREQAPWALADLGVRCLIGPGFGDIFEANCQRNGMLPVRVGPDDHAALMRCAEAAGTITVDLTTRTLHHERDGTEHTIDFAFGDAARDTLLRGVDEIDRILLDEAPRIATFESTHRQRMPWLFAASTQQEN